MAQAPLAGSVSRASHAAEQRPSLAALQKNYGKDDDSAVAAVKAVYKELDLESVFLQYEQESYNQLMAAIEGQGHLPQAVFTLFLKKIYKRTK